MVEARGRIGTWFEVHNKQRRHQGELSDSGGVDKDMSSVGVAKSTLDALKKLWLRWGNRNGMGISIRETHLSPDPRKLTLIQKTIVVVLTVYAILAIAPDTLRPFPESPLTQEVQALCKEKLSGYDCYPLGTLGFDTDNDGKIEKVEPRGPAGIYEGNQIDLESVEPDRRFINKFSFVAHRSCYSFSVRDSSHGPFTITAKDEEFKGHEKVALGVAQVSGLIFILVCMFLVWCHPMPPTWGLFFYSLWFNSGQYFFWYANLPEQPWLIIFNFIQVGLQALGLTGFLSFALYFPYNDLKGWRRSSRPYLPYLLGIVLGLLLVFNGWGFMNLVKPWQTETPFRVYYALTYCVYGLATLLLWNSYRTQPKVRPKVRWIAIFGSYGLLCWLMADTYETTGMLDWLTSLLSRWPMPWLDAHGWTTQAILNLMYAQNVMLPFAFLYTTLSHRVMGFRFLVSNAFVVLFPFILSIALIESFVETLNLPGQLILATAITVSVHDRLHRLVERWLCPQWHREKKCLEDMVKKLRDGEDLNLIKVNDMLVKGIGDALGLTSAALFYRRDDDGPFMRENVFHWPNGLEQKLPADHSFSIRDGSTILLNSLGSDPVRLRVPDDENGRNSSRDSRAAILAVPVVIGHHVSRLLLFDRDEDFDPDEVRVIREVSLAAADAYRFLDLEAR